MAQKQLQKSISASGIENVEIIIDKVFEVQIVASKTQNINIKAWAEGEHNEHLLITTINQANTLKIGCEYQPEFREYNDKLSAHKIISMKMQIEIPENLKCYIKSDIANAMISGKFNKLMVELKSGFCLAKNFYGNATINTYSGDIVMHTNYAIVNALTSNGTLVRDKIIPGTNKIALKSVNGDIKLIKTQ
jgi:hypothetical protein